jgi:hypothetical protein
MTFDSPSDLVPLVILTTAVLGGVLWLIRAQLAMHKAFQPNGGSSVKDQLNRIEADLKDARRKLDEHIDYHLNNDL